MDLTKREALEFAVRMGTPGEPWRLTIDRAQEYLQFMGKSAQRPAFSQWMAEHSKYGSDFAILGSDTLKTAGDKMAEFIRALAAYHDESSQ